MVIGFADSFMAMRVELTTARCCRKWQRCATGRRTNSRRKDILPDKSRRSGRSSLTEGKSSYISGDRAPEKLPRLDPAARFASVKDIEQKSLPQPPRSRDWWRRFGALIEVALPTGDAVDAGIPIQFLEQGGKTVSIEKIIVVQDCHPFTDGPTGCSGSNWPTFRCFRD